MSLLINEIITLQRKDGTETIKVKITRPYFGLLGACHAQRLDNLETYSREKMYLWRDSYGDWWVEIQEEEEA